ncbi:unnamed protein product [Taenia asiatica]|uniref:DUF5741 domain-containing protein n=1 Tax=Taenia asiatica TaxID=60517 RepID=A0A3P6N7T3_TAEAS|nr:unnamed protein product [Taenia asiatica]
MDSRKSPNKVADLSLLRRYNTSQDTIKNLKYECDALNGELTTCKQLLAASESKLQLVMDQLDAEKASHARCLAQRDEIEQALHSRVSDLVSDRNCQANLNDMLSAQLTQLKEHDERIKREHLRQLETLDRMLQDRERTIYELSTLVSGNQHETGDSSSQCLPAPEETVAPDEVTQLRHDDSSTIFDATADHQMTGNQPDDLAKLQRDLAVLRSKLVAQVKANTRLKTAYNALSHSMVKVPVDLSQSINPSIAEEIGANASRLSFTAGAGGDESSLGPGGGLFNLSTNKASLVLDKTVSELQATLNRLEAEISAVETSQCTSFSQSEIEKATAEASTDAPATTAAGAVSSQSLERLKSLHSLIKSLLNQFDSMRFIQRSFHETVNRSLMATSMCVEASAQKVASSVVHVESQNRSLPSSFFCAVGAAEVSAILPPNRSHSECLTATEVEQLTSATAAAEAQTPLSAPSVPLEDHEAAMAKYAARCEQLASANAALEATYMQVSEELEAAYRKHADSIAAIQAASAAKEVEFAEMEQSLNRAQASAAELETRVADLQVQTALLCPNPLGYDAFSLELSPMLAEDQCQHLLAHQEELMEEIEAKDIRVVSLEADLESVRMTAAETQVELDTLRRQLMDAEKVTTVAATNTTTVAGDGNGEMDETMREKARKYPELKAIAFDLKARLAKRAELLEASTKETRRLKRIVMEDERRAKGFLEELERLRQQILVKNALIKKLEKLALSCHSNGASAVGGGAGPSVDGVSSLVANIEATVRELSTRLESQHITSIATEGQMGEASEQAVTSLDTSISLMDELTLPSTATPSSLSVSFPDPTQPFAAIADLQDYLNRCAGQLTNLFASLMQQLENLLTSVQASNAAGGLSVGLL